MRRDLFKNENRTLHYLFEKVSFYSKILIFYFYLNRVRQFDSVLLFRYFKEYLIRYDLWYEFFESSRESLHKFSILYRLYIAIYNRK
jgi:hypothetical protein